MKYRVDHYRDNVYQVVAEAGHWSYNDWVVDSSDVLFYGSIADCEAYIRLKEKGQI